VEQLRRLAKHGASAAIAELEAEIYAIRKAFPEVDGSESRKSRRQAPRTQAQVHVAAPARPSVPMKKYWRAARGEGGAKK